MTCLWVGLARIPKFVYPQSNNSNTGLFVSEWPELHIQGRIRQETPAYPTVLYSHDSHSFSLPINATSSLPSLPTTGCIDTGCTTILLPTILSSIYNLPLSTLAIPYDVKAAEKSSGIRITQASHRPGYVWDFIAFSDQVDIPLVDIRQPVRKGYTLVVDAETARLFSPSPFPVLVLCGKVLPNGAYDWSLEKVLSLRDPISSHWSTDPRQFKLLKGFSDASVSGHHPIDMLKGARQPRRRNSRYGIGYEDLEDKGEGAHSFRGFIPAAGCPLSLSISSGPGVNFPSASSFSSVGGGANSSSSSSGFGSVFPFSSVISSAFGVGGVFPSSLSTSGPGFNFSSSSPSFSSSSGVGGFFPLSSSLGLSGGFPSSTSSAFGVSGGFPSSTSSAFDVGGGFTSDSSSSSGMGGEGFSSFGVCGGVSTLSSGFSGNVSSSSSDGGLSSTVSTFSDMGGNVPLSSLGQSTNHRASGGHGPALPQGFFARLLLADDQEHGLEERADRRAQVTPEVLANTIPLQPPDDEGPWRKDYYFKGQRVTPDQLKYMNVLHRFSGHLAPATMIEAMRVWLGVPAWLTPALYGAFTRHAHCILCEQMRRRKQHYRGSGIPQQIAGHTWSLDNVGPMARKTIGGANQYYYAQCLATGCPKLFLESDKDSEAFARCCMLIHVFCRQFGYTPAIIRIDSGTEGLSARTKELLGSYPMAIDNSSQANVESQNMNPIERGIQALKPEILILMNSTRNFGPADWGLAALAACRAIGSTQGYLAGLYSNGEKTRNQNITNRPFEVPPCPMAYGDPVTSPTINAKSGSPRNRVYLYIMSGNTARSSIVASQDPRRPRKLYIRANCRPLNLSSLLQPNEIVAEADFVVNSEGEIEITGLPEPVSVYTQEGFPNPDDSPQEVREEVAAGRAYRRFSEVPDDVQLYISHAEEVEELGEQRVTRSMTREARTTAEPAAPIPVHASSLEDVPLPVPAAPPPSTSSTAEASPFTGVIESEEDYERWLADDDNAVDEGEAPIELASALVEMSLSLSDYMVEDIHSSLAPRNSSVESVLEHATDGRTFPEG